MSNRIAQAGFCDRGRRVARSALGQACSAGSRRATLAIPALSLVALLCLALALAPRAEALSRSDSPALPSTISRANLDGTGKELSFIETLPEASGVAVDATHIYWGTREGIGRATLNGADVDERFIHGVRATAVAVDAGHVYWTTFPSGRIGRANLDGSGVNADFIPGVGACAVAVDSAHIYWVTSASGGHLGLDSPGSLGRANLEGTGVNPSFIAGELYNSGPVFSCAVAVDAAHVYWGDQNNQIGRANLGGTGVDPSFSTFHTLSSAWCGMAVDAGHLYWPDPYSVIARANLDGAEVNPRFITGGNAPCGVAVDARHIYWANGTNPSEFILFKVKRDRKRGTATLLLELPGPGVVKLRGKWVVKKSRRVTTVTSGANELVKLPVKAKGKKRKQLNRGGRTKVKARFTYTPDGGEPNTQTKRLRLIKRR